MTLKTNDDFFLDALIVFILVNTFRKVHSIFVKLARVRAAHQPHVAHFIVVMYLN